MALLEPEDALRMSDGEMALWLALAAFAVAGVVALGGLVTLRGTAIAVLCVLYAAIWFGWLLLL